MRRSAVKRQLSHLRRSVFPDLCLQLGNYPHFFFHIWPPLGPSSECTCLHSEDGSWSEDFCEEQDSLWSGFTPWLLTPKEPFCTCVASPLSPKWGECRSLNPLPKQGFASVRPCFECYLDHCLEYYLKVFIRDKDWLFTLSLLLLPFQRQNRRLIVNALTTAHLSLVLSNANSFKYPAWSLCAPWSANRRPVVNA